MWIRLLKIIFLCRLGMHPPLNKRPITDVISILECPRCHHMIVQRKLVNFSFRNVSAWDAAKGRYDKEMQ